MSYGATRKNPVSDPVREITVRTETGKLSNDLDAPVQGIADLILKMALADQRAVLSRLAFTRLVRIELMHRRATDKPLKPPETWRTNSKQTAFEWAWV